MGPRELVAVAHRALSLTPSPLLKHQRTGRFELREGVRFTRQDMAGPGFNFAAVLAAGGQRGCTSAALRSGPTALSLYQRMGFVPACTHRTYTVPA
jgi:hypothetical protein